MRQISAIFGVGAAWLARFLRAQGGNSAMVFGLSLVTLLTSAGAGVDFARAMMVRNRVAAALDAAALAVGGQQNLNQQQLQSLAQQYFDANYPTSEIGVLGPVSVSLIGDVISLSVAASVPTTLLKIANFDTIDMGVTNEVTRGSLALEVALVLDNTGSMAGSKIAALKTAATTLVDTLSGNSSSPAKLKIGVVPFTQAVRVSTVAALAGGWIDTTCASSVAKLNFNNNMCAFTVLATMNPSTKWGGCVESRPILVEVQDTAPSLTTPDTLWVPYFQPDEPDTNDSGIDDDYTNHYIDDGTSTSNELTRLMRSAKYIGKSQNSNVNSNCNMPAILPLSNDMTAVKSVINSMGAAGYTHIPLGAAWGWRVLSPAAPYTEGVAYDDGKTQKAMILMTDGENTMPSQSTMNKSRYTAFGYLRQGRLGTVSSISGAEQKMDQMLTDVCNNIDQKGIRIYTIGFAISTQNVLTLLKNCATEPSMFYNSPTAADLQAAFSSIATDLSNLRLSK